MLPPSAGGKKSNTTTSLTKTGQTTGQNKVASSQRSKVFVVKGSTADEFNSACAAVLRALEHAKTVKQVELFKSATGIERTFQGPADDHVHNKCDIFSSREKDSERGFLKHVLRTCSNTFEILKIVFWSGAKTADYGTKLRLLYDLRCNDKINYLYVHKYAARIDEHFLNPKRLWRLIRPRTQIALITGR